MSKIHGRSPLPLPPSLLDSLGGIGYRRIEDGGRVALFRHPSHPELFLEVTASNLPGDTQVIARWAKQNATRITIDLLIAKLALQINQINAPIRPMERT